MPSPTTPSSRSWSGVEFLVIAAVGYLLFFHRLGELPIYVWDEARDTINALEMLRTGDLLVTYFHGRPDLWNTKPPGAIWLMAGSMRLFGVNEFALRLPSALAGLLTTLIVYGFTRRVSDSRWAGLLGAVVLMATAGYVGPHVTRTADYDSLLVLFTTAGVLSFGLALEQGAPRTRWLLISAAATAMAILVKGVAGILLLPGLLIFAVVAAKAPALIKSRGAWLSAALVVAVTAAFYGLRELAEPGYLRAVVFNELGGRFSGAIEGHGGPWWYYLSEAAAPWPLWFRWPVPESQVMGSAFPWSWLAPLSALLALMSLRPAVRRAALLIVVVTAAYLVIISGAATKLTWYLAPTFPLIAIVTALGAQRVWEWRGRRVLPALSVAAACVVALAVAYKNHREIEASPNRSERMTAAFIKQVFAAHPALSPVRIVHDGHGTKDGQPYTAPEEFYVTALRERGLDVSIVRSSYRGQSGETVLRCAALPQPAAGDDGEVLLRNKSCAAVRLRGAISPPGS